MPPLFRAETARKWTEIGQICGTQTTLLCRRPHLVQNVYHRVKDVSFLGATTKEIAKLARQPHRSKALCTSKSKTWFQTTGCHASPAQPTRRFSRSELVSHTGNDRAADVDIVAAFEARPDSRHFTVGV